MKQNKKLKKADKIYLLLLIFGLILFAFSTKIVLLVTGRNLDKKQIDISIMSPDIVHTIDQISDPEGLFKEVFVRGWAFNKSYQKSSKRYVTVIFRNEDFSYEILAEMGPRADVTNNLQEYDLSQNDIGFSFTFSIIAMQDGVYEMLIKAWEENGTPEIASTQRFFKVDKVTFTEVTDEIGHNLGPEE